MLKLVLGGSGSGKTTLLYARIRARAEQGLRSILTKEPAALSDCEFDELESKLTAKGISLLAGGISDPCIVV